MEFPCSIQALEVPAAVGQDLTSRVCIGERKDVGTRLKLVKRQFFHALPFGTIR
jgi:hypothetical protein